MAPLPMMSPKTLETLLVLVVVMKVTRGDPRMWEGRGGSYTSKPRGGAPPGAGWPGWMGPVAIVNVVEPPENSGPEKVRCWMLCAGWA